VKIIVATDGSRTSAAAVRFASWIASATRGRLEVVAAGELAPGVFQEGPDSDALSVFESVELRTARAALESARRETRRVAVPVRCEYVAARRFEPFAETISRAADRFGADLAVVGSGGGPPLSRWLRGSVANRLVHVAHVPVAVVRTAKRSSRRPARILVATDGSQTAAKAVRFAARLTSAIPGARLVILNVSTLTADLALTGVGVVRTLGLMPELERADRRAADRILRTAAKQARLGKRASLRYYRPARRLFAAKAILEEAKRQRADVIVLGRTGRSALGDVFMGSVAQRVLTLASQPVILVPPSFRASRRSR
jgi:nucleotide-binding universal stress UspA family protein